MDQSSLAASAHELEALLTKYSSTDLDAKSLLTALAELLSDAQSGKITAPLGWSAVPGTYHFNEGHLGQFKDLESAYAQFKIDITGGESPALRTFILSNVPESI